MTLAENFLQQIDYNFWANRLVGDAMINANMIEGKAFDLFCHVLGAEETWLARCLGIESRFAIWPEIAPSQWASISIDHYHSLQSLVMDRADDLDGIISYRNSKGDPYETPVAGIVQHLSLHNQYHRGQINSRLREAGHTPPAIDFILFQWRGGAKDIPALLGIEEPRVSN